MGQHHNPQWPIVNPTPRDPALEWHVGITFAPFTEAEWGHFTWAPLWRVEIDQAQAVTDRGASCLLLAAAQDDASVAALLPYLPKAWGIELGNEPDLQDPQALNTWYRRMIPIIRDSGFGGLILTAGIANLNDDTLEKAAQSIDGLWPDIVFAWHAYGAWKPQIPKLLGMLNGRHHAMTESGYNQPTPEAEALAVTETATSAQIIYEASALIYSAYQCHSGPPGSTDADFGIFYWDRPATETRPYEQSLIGAIR